MKAKQKRALAGIGLIAVAGLALVGCSSKSTVADASAVSDNLKTDFGISGDTLTIAALTDQSGPYAALGTTLAQGNQLYFDQRNADGGVCGFKVKVEVRDHGNDVQTAVSQFSELEPNVLGFVQLLGSPQVNGVKAEVESKAIPSFVASWSSDFLGSEALAISGTIYPYDIVNALDYLSEEGTIAKGSTVGHVHLPGDFGENALKGSKFYGERGGIEVLDISVEPTATDYSAQVQQLVDADVDAILISGTPPQVAGITTGTSALGLDVPVITNGPGSPSASLLESAAGEALQKRVKVVTSYLPYGAEGSQEAQSIVKQYEKTFPEGQPTIFVNYGYAVANVFGEALDAACESGDMTRQGVLDALRGLPEIETGIFPSQNFGDVNASASTQSVILGIDAKTKGGLVVEKEFFESDLTSSFTS